MAAKKKGQSVKKYSPHDSPLIQIGIVFVIIAAMFLMFYAGTLKNF